MRKVKVTTVKVTHSVTGSSTPLSSDSVWIADESEGRWQWKRKLLEVQVHNRVRWFEKIFLWRLNYLTRYQDKRSCLPGKPWGGSLYPPQTSPRWQNFSWYSGKVIFFRFLFFSWIRRFHLRSYPPQLPRETLWRWWIRPLLLFIPPTSVGIMTEKL